jgi:RNA polymerase sigma factor (sigma-70 family)
VRVSRDVNATPDVAAGGPVERAAAYERLVTVLGPRLRRALLSAYGVELGEDAYAEVLAWAWEHFERVAELAEPVGYLFRVGQSKARIHLGFRRRLPESITVSVDDVPFDEELAVALSRLSLEQRTSALLVHGYGWSYREVAALLDTTESAVRNHLHRGMARLRRSLGGA